MFDSAALRILDANFNRAREALRVIEDHARLGLDDRNAASRAKQLRHALAECAREVGSDRLLAARDINGDVGCETKTASEQTRAAEPEIIRAAFARLAEATRALGEYAKLVAPGVAARLEHVRYQSYALEPSLLARGQRRAAFRAVRLYVIVTAALCRRDWRATARAALAGGAGALQLREKQLDDAELLRRAGELRELTRDVGALLILNDRPDVARLVDADGVHVGQTDLPVGAARRIAGGERLVGKSTHTREQFEAALVEQPDYLAIGPMYASPTKPQEHLAGITALATAARRCDLPLVAIGGITPANAAQVRAAGATCLCVCSAVLAAEDPAAVCRALSA